MPLTRAIGVVLATAACARPDEGGADAPAAVHVNPASVYFGLVEWGSTATQAITISNDGDEDANVERLVLSTDQFAVDGAGPFTIPAGEAVERTLEWTPATIDGLDASLEVLGKDGPYARISVTGGTSYAVLDVVGNDGADFGAVPVGCARVAHVTLANDGGADLVVSWTREADQAELSVRDSSGNSVESPMSIPPRTSERIEVEYAPDVVHEIDSTLEITTNDPFAPTLEVDVRGEGLWNEPHAVEWTVGITPQTILFHVNERVFRDTIGEPWPERFEEFLPAFFDALLAAHVPFRIALLKEPDGQVLGDVPYIDDSFTSAEAVDTAHGMLPVENGDNDAGLETCLQALVENAEWAQDLAAPWPESKLNVVSVNPDAEQSPWNATYYIDAFAERVGSANIAVHGIAGDAPTGCNSGGYADPSEELYDATVESGGVFLSICDGDWTKTAAALASACTRFSAFRFTEHPLAGSIHVSVDAIEMLEGWSYDATIGRLIFDDVSYPPDGAVVRAEYLLAESCD